AHRCPGPCTAHSIRRLVVKNHPRVGSLRLGRGLIRAMTSGAGFTQALCHSGAFKARRVAIGAIAASSLSARDMNQMELIFYTELRDHAAQFLPLPLGLRNAVPGPSPVDHRITEGPPVRRLQHPTVEGRYESAAVTMAADTGDVGDQGRAKIATVVFAVAINAGQR